MTNKEAIFYLKQVREDYEEFIEGIQAIDLAIKLLEEYPTDKEIQDDMRRTYLGGEDE